MIKLIANIFKDKEEIPKSNIEIEVDVPQKTKEEAFDEAVEEVRDRKIKEALLENLERFVIGDEAYDQTKKAQKKYTYPQVGEEEFPLAKRKYSGSFLYYDTEITSQELIDKLMKLENDGQTRDRD